MISPLYSSLLPSRNREMARWAPYSRCRSTIVPLHRDQRRGTSSSRYRCPSWQRSQLICWTGMCSFNCQPVPASSSGRAGARPDHSISCHRSSSAPAEQRPKCGRGFQRSRSGWRRAALHRHSFLPRPFPCCPSGAKTRRRTASPAELASLASVLPVATCAMMREVAWITCNSFVGSHPASQAVSAQRPEAKSCSGLHPVP